MKTSGCCFLDDEQAGNVPEVLGLQVGVLFCWRIIQSLTM